MDNLVDEAPTRRGYEDVLKDERRQVRLICLSGAALLFVLLVVFYPCSTSSIDETRYLSASRYFLQGKAFDRDSSAWFWKPRRGDEVLDRALNALSPLFSVILMPFVMAGWRSTFVLGVTAHVLGFIGMVRLLQWRGLSPVWAFLYLLYPPFVLYSRTVMIDVPAASLVVLVLVLLHRPEPNYFHVGLAMGFMVLLKVSTFPIVLAFFGLMFVQDVWSAARSGMFRQRIKHSRWLPMAFGGLPFAAILLLSNVFLFNSLFGSAYVGREAGMFGFRYLPRNLPFYAGSLMLMYPFMLVSPVFMKGAHAWEFKVSCLVVILLFSSYYFIDEGNTWYEMIIRGQRFMLIAMPLFIVAYAEMLTRLAYTRFREKLLRVAMVGMILVLIPVGAVIAGKHRDFTIDQAERSRQLSAVLPRGATVVPGSMVVKYLNAAVRPDLRIVRLARVKFLPYVLEPENLPAYLVLVSADDVRTRAYQPLAEYERKTVLDLLGKHFTAERVPEGLQWVDVWRLDAFRDEL